MSIRRILRNKKFQKFIREFKAIKDKRIKGKVKHPLEGCLIIIVLAMLSGCNYFREYVLFANKHKNKLVKLGLLPNGIPSHDTLERISHKINKDELNKALLNILFPSFKQRPIIALDGKCVRASKNTLLDGTYMGMKNILTMYETVNKQSIISESIGDKGNEINVIPKLIKKFHELFPNIKPYISIDGIGITNEIIDLLSEYDYDYVIVYKRSDRVIQEIKKLYPSNNNLKTITDIEYNSSRIEKRTFVFLDMEDIVGLEQWTNKISHLGRMNSVITNKRSGEVSRSELYFFTSNISLNEFRIVRRHHWLIENSLHYVLDNSFKEDRMRMKKGSACENMNLLRKFVLNVVALTNLSHESVAAFRDNLKYATPQLLLYKILGAMH